MTWLPFLLFSAGGLALAALVAKRRLQHPAPESFIIRLPDDTSDRFLPLEGSVNFRDAGGYRTADGQRVRRGLVFRSGTLANLTDADLSALAALGLKLVCDLRGAQETAAEPERLPTNPAPIYLHLPLTVADERSRRLPALLFNPRRLAPMLTEMYTRTMIDANARLYGDILRRLADSANLPMLIHCTAGKDRTGVAVALLLLALGVPEETIVADYSLSNYYFDDFYRYGQRAVARLRWLGVRADDLRPLLVADPATMRAALVYIRQTYGSAETYLLTAAGLDAATLAALQANLLE